MKLRILFLFILLLSISCQHVAKAYIDANYSTNKQHGPQYLNYILADEKLDNFAKRVKLLSYLENMKLNNDTYKEVYELKDSELDALIIQFAIEGKNLK